MGGRGTFALGRNVAYQYETVGTIEGVKVLEKKNKRDSTALPEEAHHSNAYILIGKDGEVRQYREFNENHTVKFDIDYQAEKNVFKSDKKILHMHYYENGVRNKPRILTEEEIHKYKKYFNVNKLQGIK